MMGSGRIASCITVLSVVRRSAHRWNRWRAEQMQTLSGLCETGNDQQCCYSTGRFISFLRSAPATSRWWSPWFLWQDHWVHILSLSLPIQALWLWAWSYSARPSTAETGTVPPHSCPQSGSPRCCSSSWASFLSPSPVDWWWCRAGAARPPVTHGGSPSWGVCACTRLHSSWLLVDFNMLKVWVEIKVGGKLQAQTQ